MNFIMCPKKWQKQSLHLKCTWNDEDYSCISPSGEEVYQCPMYIHYHPEEVSEFEKYWDEWAKQKKLEGVKK